MKRFLAYGWKASASTAIALAFTVGATHAADDTWSSSPTDSDWGNTANWVNATPPGSTTGTSNTDTATFTTSSIVAVTVDAGRNLQNITFGGNNTFTLSGSTLLLTSGGTILSNGSAVDERISAPLQIQGDGGTYKIETNTPGTNRELQISGGISGVATTGNTTVLTLTGSSGGTNEITSAGAITNGSGGGALALVKDGTGLWVLGQANGANTYSGGTTIKAGTLRVSSSGNTTGLIGSGTLTLDGGTLRLQSSNSTTVNNNVVVGANGGTVSARTNDYFNPATLSGTGVLTLTPDNGLTFSSNSFKGFAGTVRALPLTSGTMSLRFVSSFDETSLANAVLVLEAGASQTRNYGTNDTRTTGIGTLSGAAGSSLGGSTSGGGIFIFSVGGRNEDSTFAGTIVDGGTKTGLTKVGSATLTLSGTNTYTGATTVAAGVLAVDGSVASTVTVQDTATLQGIGTVANATVNAGGHVAPGNSIGTLSVTGDMTINGTLDVEYDGGGSLIDLLAVTGTLDINNATVDFAPLNTALTGSPFIFATYGTLSGSQFASVVDLPGGYTIDYAYNNGTTTTNIALVPEPTAALLAGLGLLGLVRRRRA